MIDVAVLLLWWDGRLPFLGLVVILGRDVVLLTGAKLLQPRGLEVHVNFLGKAATWILYASIFFVLADTRRHALAARLLLDRRRAGGRRGHPVRPHREAGAARMKAVVMAGGEGTRLRPLTSNQPKPMVPIVGKPCMEHIVELLAEHGLTT